MLPAPAVPASTMISARLKCAKEHVHLWMCTCSGVVIPGAYGTPVMFLTLELARSISGRGAPVARFLQV